MDGLKRYVNDDRFRVDGDKNMRLLAFAFTIVFVWTGPGSFFFSLLLAPDAMRVIFGAAGRAILSTLQHAQQ